MGVCCLLRKAIICCVETTQRWRPALLRKLSISCATCSDAPAAAGMPPARPAADPIPWKKCQNKMPRNPHSPPRNKEPGKSSVKDQGQSQDLPWMLCQEEVTSLPQWEKPGNRREGQEFKQGGSIFRNSTVKQRQKQAGNATLFQHLFPHILFFFLSRE